MDRYVGEQGEWVLLDGTTATIGLTKAALDTLGQIVWLSLPQLNALLKQGDTAVVVESAKAATDIISPLTGTVTEVNTALSTSVQLLNDDPEHGGWLFKLRDWKK